MTVVNLRVTVNSAAMIQISMIRLLLNRLA